MTEARPVSGGEIAVYQAADGAVRVEARLERDTVWLTKQQMAELFGRERSVISKHTANVFADGELEPAAIRAYLAQVRQEGPRTVRREVDHYNLDVIISVGYGFLSSILPYTNAEWEKLSIFLGFLVPKLPAPVEEDLSRGILEAIDMDSYRVEKQAAARIQLPDADAEIAPVPTAGGGRKAEPELDRLSNILEAFNDQFGNIPWSDADRVHKLIVEDIPNRVAADKAYQNARQNSDKQNARIEHDKALARVMTAVLKDDTELFT